MPSSPRTLATALLTALLLSAIPGCSQSDPLKSPAAARLKGLATMYLDYAAAKGSGPPDEQAFRKHLRAVEGFVLQMNGVDPQAIDETFISPRDNHPFVIVYGVGISGISGTKAPLIAYEKTGLNGKRLVAFANTKLAHVDEAQLQQLQTQKQ